MDIIREGQVMSNNSRIKEIIGALPISDLKILREDMTNNHYSLKLIDEIIEKFEQSKKVCAACGTSIDPYSDEKIVITFGPQGLERKGHFCAYDCMNYFMEKYKKNNLEKSKDKHSKKEENNK
ncbi:MAG: hypothetical protein WC755_07490 [Candidatus Woesearchaeota archaeon]|jgi:hypothetical protein